MASKAKVGRGTAVSIGGVTGAGGAETFTAIAECVDASFTGAAWGTEDVTNFDSGVDDEFVTTTRNNGEVNLKFNLVDADPGQVALNAASNAGQRYDFKVQLKPGPSQTTGTLYMFSALVLNFLDLPITVRGVLQVTAKLKISGPVTPTIGS